MDQRRSAPHPFSRPPSSQPSHDPRFAPIPPPPYTSQSATHRAEIPHASDPFLRRRNEHEDQRRSPPTNPTRPYTFPIHSQLNANPFSDASDFANIAQPRRNSYGSAAPFDARLADRYGSRITSGTCFVSYTRVFTRVLVSIYLSPTSKLLLSLFMHACPPAIDFDILVGCTVVYPIASLIIDCLWDVPPKWVRVINVLCISF